MTLSSTTNIAADDVSSVNDYLSLLKPGVMSLVVFSGMVGMLLAPGTLHPFLQLITIACIALGCGSGGAINMWYDRDIDRIMVRTANRAVAAGRITPDNALAFGITLGILSVALLGLAVNWLAAGILAFAIFFYAVIYTVYLKRSTPQNIVIGGAAGAFPPIIGWAAVTGNVTLFPILMFAIIFLWTPPHFWALALYRNSDYKRAGVPMLPVVAGVEVTKKHIVAYSWILVITTLLPTAFHYLSFAYAIGAALLGAQFLRLAQRVYRSNEDGPAKKLFGYSILYLFCLFTLMLADKLLITIF